MDADVLALVQAERLLEAAELASRRGDSRSAASIFERACAWPRAAQEAQKSGDFARAFLLAREGRDDALARTILPQIASEVRTAERVAYQLERRGDYAWAARLYEAADKKREAAGLWERAGNAARAAELLEAAGDVAGAARSLEAALRKNADQPDLSVKLGELLVRYGKAEAAVRVLQRVKPEAHERRAALTLLTRAFASLGLTRAEAEIAEELDALGGPASILERRRSAAPVTPRVFGRYEVLAEVASTPSARVLECLDVVRQEHVAVKIFAGYDARGAGRDALMRFEREVKVLASLDHANIVPLRDYVEEGPALVMAWMNGGTLEDLLAKEPVAPSRAIEIASSVLLALGEAHRLGVLHRDVKPANVLFDAGGTAKLGDFGVAHLGDLSATATAGVIGTLGYMSPEQRDGTPATVRSDVYGVGAMLLEMLTGQRPVVDDPAPLRPSAAHRDLDTRHDDVVMRMLQKDPELRPEGALAARALLGTLKWPTVVERIAVRRVVSERPSQQSVEEARYVLRDGRLFDTWLERFIERLPLSDELLARASAYAKAAHPALQAVLSVDRKNGALVLSVPWGRRLDRQLAPPEIAWLRAALGSLHESGFVHGAVDAAHVFVDDVRGPQLQFEPASASGSVDQDRIALARLAG